MVYQGNLITGMEEGLEMQKGEGPGARAGPVEGAGVSPPFPGQEGPLKLPLLMNASSE